MEQCQYVHYFVSLTISLITVVHFLVYFGPFFSVSYTLHHHHYHHHCNTCRKPKIKKGRFEDIFF